VPLVPLLGSTSARIEITPAERSDRRARGSRSLRSAGPAAGRSTTSTSIRASAASAEHVTKLRGRRHTSVTPSSLASRPWLSVRHTRRHRGDGRSSSTSSP
jgi:hypothetical protein